MWLVSLNYHCILVKLASTMEEDMVSVRWTRPGSVFDGVVQYVSKLVIKEIDAEGTEKMAESGPIRVCVLEGVYAHLPRLGFPLSVAVELQNSNLRFDSAKWSTRQSGGGFSVTFFWPSLPGGRKATNQSNRKCNRRRRNRKSKSLVYLSPCRDSTTISGYWVFLYPFFGLQTVIDKNYTLSRGKKQTK